jgi:hypothetical protein
MCDYLRELNPPLDAKSLRPLSKRVETLQFRKRLTDDEHQQVAKLLRNRPDVTLRVYAIPNRMRDLRFLRHYPFAKKVAIDLYDLKSIEGVEHLPSDLRSFDFGLTKSKQLSLSFLKRFTKLEALEIDGHTKDIDSRSV